MTKRLFALLAVIVAPAVLAAGCTQPHLSENFGRSYNSWFVAQHVNQKFQDPTAARAFIEGLDAQEAATVSKTYRAAASKGGDTSGGQSRLLLVGPQRGGNEGYMPPPSVPGGQ